jgi:hypothetical protein
MFAPNHNNFKQKKMKILKFCLLLGIALPGLMIANAQTAEEIIAKHIEAIGGKDKLSQIKSIHTESTVAVMGSEGANTSNLLVGKGFKEESEFNGQKVVQCYTDKGGWAINPFAGGTDAQAMSDAQYKAGRDRIFVDGTLAVYQSRGGKLELLGKENVGTVSAFKIKETDPDSSSVTYYFDPTTFYVLKVARTMPMNGQDVELSMTPSNYQKTDFGNVVPFAMEMAFGEQFSLTYTVKKIEINKEVDPKIFDMPK